MNEVDYQKNVDLLIVAGVGFKKVPTYLGLEPISTGGLPFPMRTLGPSKIAHRVREAGYTCQIIDFFEYFEKDELLLAMLQFVGPRTIIGVSTTFFTDDIWRNPDNNRRLQDLLFIFGYLKDKFNCKILVGGPSAHKFGPIFKADKYIIGYAENEIIRVLDNWRNRGISKKRVSPWEITACEHRWHTSSFLFEGEALPLEIGRGCIFHCKFCRFEMLGKKKGTYVRTFDRIYDEIIYNYKNFKTTKYLIVEDTFNDDQNKMKAWFEMVKSLPFKIEYTAYLRADLLHKFQDTAYELYDTGLFSASFGLETLHPYAAKAIGKSWSAKHAPTFIPKLHNEIWKKNVICKLNWIVGLPGENEDHLEKTKNWLLENELKCPLFSPLSIVPYTEQESDPNILRSIFDKQYSEYGYRVGFPNKSLRYWENDLMTYDTATAIALNLNTFFEQTSQTGNWRAIALRAVGLSRDYILKTARVDLIKDPMVINKIINHLDTYKNKMFQYS